VKRALPLLVGLWLLPGVAAAEEPPEAFDDDAPAAEDYTRPPSAGRGAVWGVVTDRRSKEPLADAQVTVLGTGKATATDLEGRFRLDLPPGTYQLRIAAELHKLTRVTNVRVAAGKVARLDVPLEADAAAVEETEAVVAEVERSSAGAQLLLRKNAAAASDAVGAQDIAKTPDRNAADALKRVVGTTVTDGRYVVVRGLGDRYTNALLNGSPLPSPEPDKQAVPLDMFPTLVMSDLVVKKTFTPDMPGDFAGGSLDIHTRDIPDKFTLSANLGAGFNTESTFKHRLSYPGGKLDFLGFDDGGRKLPASLPGERVTRLRADGTLNDRLTELGRDVTTPMQTNRAFDLPNGTGSFVVGDRFDLGKAGKLGYVAGATYSRRFTVRRDETVRTFGVDPQKPGALVRFNDYRAETGIDTVTWSGLGSTQWVPSEDHRVALTGLYSRNAEKEGRFIEGFNDEQGANIQDERVRFVNRGLAYGQLRGEHRFPTLGAAVLEWRAVYARATLSDPNLRETIYQESPEGGFVFRESSQSGQHFYASQGETTRSVGLDWTQPLVKSAEEPIAMKGGALVSLRGRSFSARRFRFLRNPSADPATFRQSPDALFAAENVGPALELAEWTAPTDTYAARYDVVAGYAMSDVSIGKRLRAVLGGRVERGTQTIDSFDPFAPGAADSSSRLARTDLLPSANVLFRATKDVNVRAAASVTVARPQLRELAPFIFTEFLGAREVLGNPELDRTRVQNYDVRVEYFPSPTEVLAVSGFHKRFAKPIEPVILPTSRGVLSYQNADGATTTGVELEAKKKLGFVTRHLADFALLGNVTLATSQVDLDPSKVGLLTNTSRPLAGQSPWVVNVALDYEREASKTRARVLYNVIGARIAQVGLQGLPDTYEQPRHVVDVSVSQALGKHVDVKATIENVLDAPFRYTLGDDGDATVANRWIGGRTAWITGTYTY
jgi:hypothetical protein